MTYDIKWKNRGNSTGNMWHEVKRKSDATYNAIVSHPTCKLEGCEILAVHGPENSSEYSKELERKSSAGEACFYKHKNHVWVEIKLPGNIRGTGGNFDNDNKCKVLLGETISKIRQEHGNDSSLVGRYVDIHCAQARSELTVQGVSNGLAYLRPTYGAEHYDVDKAASTFQPCAAAIGILKGQPDWFDYIANGLGAVSKKFGGLF